MSEGLLSRLLRITCAGTVGVAIVLGSTLSCGDGTPTSPGSSVPDQRPVGSYNVDVDVPSGAVTVTSGSSHKTSGASFLFFGAKPEVQYIFSPATQGFDPMAAGKVTFTVPVRVKNLLSSAIGTHVSRAISAPSDTMGVFVYVYNPPHATAGCTPGPSCEVSVVNADGQASFDPPRIVPQQPARPDYWYWREIVESNDVTSQKNWTFRLDEAVTRFSFGISVYAATPKDAGRETRWKVTYVPDSVPNQMDASDLRSEPTWKVMGTTRLVQGSPATTDTTVTSSCPGDLAPCLKIRTLTDDLDNGYCPPNSSDPNSSDRCTFFFYYRSDPLSASDDAYMQATVSATKTSPQHNATIFVGMQDDARLMQLGISTYTGGFTDSTGYSFTPSSDARCRPTPPKCLFTPPSTATPTTYRIVKNGTSTVQVFVGSSTTPVLEVPYDRLAPTPYKGAGNAPKPYFWFGNQEHHLDCRAAITPCPAMESFWTDITYEIGATAP